MGAVSDVLFSDDDLKDLHCADNGRLSLPPSLMCGVLLLQFYDDVSDEEAIEQLQFDLRWKVALDLPLDYAGFDPSSLSYFRRRLGERKHQLQRLWTSAAVNLKRLFTLAQVHGVDLGATLSRLAWRPAGVMTV